MDTHRDCSPASLISGVSDPDLVQYRHLCLLQLFQDDDRYMPSNVSKSIGTADEDMYGPAAYVLAHRPISAYLE